MPAVYYITKSVFYVSVSAVVSCSSVGKMDNAHSRWLYIADRDCSPLPSTGGMLWSLPPPASLPPSASFIWTCSYTLYKPAIDSATCRIVYITTVIKTASYWRLPGHLQLYTPTDVYHAANVSVYIVRYRDMKCHDILVSSLAYDMNITLQLISS